MVVFLFLCRHLYPSCKWLSYLAAHHVRMSSRSAPVISKSRRRLLPVPRAGADFAIALALLARQSLSHSLLQSRYRRRTVPSVNMYEQIHATAASLRLPSLSPRVGVILGSGLGDFISRVQIARTTPYAEIPNFPLSSVAGHAGALIQGTVEGVACAVMSGRVHYYEGYTPEQVIFPVRVLAALGVRHVVVTNAAGAVHREFQAGDLMAITDHLNFTGANPLRGANDERLGPRFPDMGRPYSTAGQAVWSRSAKRTGVSLRQGIYAGVAGPSYETPAEIRMLRTFGADAVGMSTVFEVIAARHLGLEVLGLSVIANQAIDVTTEPLTHDQVQAAVMRIREPLCALLANVVGELGIGAPARAP
jgi:purine-nucleoside phosphorylase